MTRRVFSNRVDQSTPDIVDSIAKELGCLRLDRAGVLKGSTGIMLDKIAQGRLRIISTTPD
jgi:hypothetical protein